MSRIEPVRASDEQLSKMIIAMGALRASAALFAPMLAPLALPLPQSRSSPTSRHLASQRAAPTR